MDFLEQHKPEVEKSVPYFAMADLMNADVDVVFYDTTSLHFEVDDEDEQLGRSTRGSADTSALRKRGHSKNGRGDAPQIVIGLAITRDGLPVRSWVCSRAGRGRRDDRREGQGQDLRGWRLGRCVFVGDAGMNSADNRRKLALGNGKYILGSRMRTPATRAHPPGARAPGGRYKQVRRQPAA